MRPITKRVSAAAAAATLIAIPAEGLRQWAYYDPVGILTVCYGSTTNVKQGVKYSLEECKARLSSDMLKAVEIVDRCHPGLPVKILAAFGDGVFNMGPTIACDRKNSTAARLLDQQKYVGACNQLPRWNKARVVGILVELPGLTNRRAKERELCLQGAYEWTSSARTSGGF
jgi:lysozyme